jgi:hypothetical protein
MSFVNLERIAFSDSPNIDAFGRLRVSEARTLFDSQQEYGLSTRIWGTATSGGSSSVAVNGTTKLTVITCGTGAADLAVLQSNQYIRYIPGKSHLILMTGVFSPGNIANNLCNSGYFDSANGIFLRVAAGVVSFVRRTSTSGSVVDNVVNQADWNVDNFDGTGPSGVTLDLTKIHVLYIAAQWLGAGRIEVGFNVDGIFWTAHRFLTANILTVPSTQTFNLPVRMESRNSAGTSGNSVIAFNCCSVQSEGGIEERGFARTANNGITEIAVTTRRPILSIRPAATFGGFVNRAHIEAASLSMKARTNDSLFEIVYGGTLTGAAFATVGTGSAAEFDTAATAITGGTIIKSGYVATGAGIVSTSFVDEFDVRLPMTIIKIDGGATIQDSVSIVATSITGTSNMQAQASWFEQII